MSVEATRASYRISTDPARLDLDVIHGYLTRSYWAAGIPRATVQRAIAHSHCYGVYDSAQQVGFARVITDYATVAYLADVFILESHRGPGLSKWLMECILADPDLQGLRRWLLFTRDAHGLYRQYGFTAVPDPTHMMQIRDPDVYKQRPES